LVSVPFFEIKHNQIKKQTIKVTNILNLILAKIVFPHKNAQHQKGKKIQEQKQ